MSSEAITLVTGNRRKIEDARTAFEKHGINFDVSQLDIDEI